MSSKIETVTIGTSDKRLVLSNSSVARLFDFGSSWTKLRIGMRLAFDDTGGNITLPKFRVGVLSAPSANMANGPNTTITSHFWGMGTMLANFTRGAGPPVFYTTQFSSTKRIGNTDTSSGGNPGRFSASPSSVRPVYIVSLWKGTDGNADWNTMSLRHIDSTIPNDDIPDSALDDVMLVGAQNANHNSGMTELRDALREYAAADYENISHSALTINEGTNGAFDALCVAWNTAASGCHISELKYCKIG